MLQHISVERVDENGKTIGECEVNFADIMNKLYEVVEYKTAYPTLSRIDPYGNTYFNILQRPDVIKELDDFSLKTSIDTKDSLIAFINDTGIHQYIKFVGD